MLAHRVFCATSVILVSVASVQAQTLSQRSQAGHLGVSPGETYTYRFVDTLDVTNGAWSSDEKLAVGDAFKKWQEADSKSGLNTTFAAWTGGPSAQIILRKRLLPALGGASVPAKTLASTGEDGTVTGGTVDFNTDTTIISNKNGFLKAALHEIGHLHGLGHPKAKGSHWLSVMNDFGELPGGKLYQKRDDYTRNIPDDVTKQDRESAYLFAGSRKVAPAVAFQP